jgi:hypothetical protein
VPARRQRHSPSVLRAVRLAGILDHEQVMLRAIARIGVHVGRLSASG